MGPWKDFFPNLFAWFSILGITIPYLIIVAPPVYHTISKAIPIINGISLLFTIVFFLFAGLTDPGIIPRKKILEAIESELLKNFI